MTIEYKFFVQILTLFEAVPFFDILCGKNLSSFLYVELVIIFNNIFFHKLKNKPIMFQQFHNTTTNIYLHYCLVQNSVQILEQRQILTVP